MGILETKCPHTFLHSVTGPANALEFSGCPVFYVHRTDLWAIGFNDKLFPLGAPWHGQSFMPLLDTLKNVDIPVYYNKGVCHSHCGLAIYIKKSILRQKKNYGNSNISSCKNIIFKKSSKRNQKSFKIL
jgi:hypothetical protein